jgi:hypothetical protein
MLLDMMTFTFDHAPMFARPTYSLNDASVATSLSRSEACRSADWDASCS